MNLPVILKNALSKTGRFISRNAGTIGTVISIAGVVGCVAVTMAQTPKILGDDNTEEEDSLIHAAKRSIPIAVVASITILAILKTRSHYIHRVRELETGLLAVSATLLAYRDEVRTRYGDDVEKDIAMHAARRRYSEDCQRKGSNEMMTFFDMNQIAMFEARESDILAAEDYVNEQISKGYIVDYNIFWGRAGIDIRENEELCDYVDLVWNPSNEEIQNRLAAGSRNPIGFAHELSVLDDGMEVIILSYAVEPTASGDYGCYHA